MTKNFFESKIKPLLLYIGTIGAGAMSVAYIILMFVLVIGFKAQANMNQAIIFALVNAFVGFVIMQFLKIQGIDFAKQIPENVYILKQYNTKKEKKKQTHSLKYFWIKSITIDIAVKVLTIAITTAGIIYIVIEGSNDFNMLLLSIVNLIMFACFGLLALVNSYDFFNNQYIPYLCEQLEIKVQEIPDVKNEEVNEQLQEEPDTQIINQGDNENV